jgi:cell division protein FtsB
MYTYHYTIIKVGGNTTAKKTKNKTPKTKLGFPLKMLIFIAGTALVLFCLWKFISAQADLEERQQQLLLLQEKAQALAEENAEYESILSETDERTYIERIAVEVLGFAYPNERRFYDSKG